MKEVNGNVKAEEMEDFFGCVLRNAGLFSFHMFQVELTTMAHY